VIAGAMRVRPGREGSCSARRDVCTWDPSAAHVGTARLLILESPTLERIVATGFFDQSHLTGTSGGRSG
jgi:hypothetical protein